MNDLNEIVVNWFERGKIKEALLGEGKYFIPDPTYRDCHNILLVVDCLICWAYKNNKSEEISKHITVILMDFSILNPWLCADILVCYAIKAEGLKKKLTCDFFKIFNSLHNNLSLSNRKDSKFNITPDNLLIEIKKLFNKIGVFLDG